MPREKFWQPDHAENEQPDLTIRWAPEVLFVQGDILVTRDDTSGLDRMIQSLKRARRALLGASASTEHVHTYTATTQGLDLVVESTDREAVVGAMEPGDLLWTCRGVECPDREA